MMVHETFMRQCFALAKKGAGNVSPNPLVGSIIVKNNQIIGSGYHAKVGGDHAELAAIKNADQNLEGATLYCNLEPCCHTNKRTPPCAQRIISEKIKTVVIANLDPNPLVAGNGVKLLRDHGIEVITDILTSEGAQLNEIFFHHIVKKMPFIHLKMAQTMDGKLATNSGDSKWITSSEARLHVHQMRNYYDGILIGANTLKKDNPHLTIRLPEQSPRAMKRFILNLSSDLDYNLNVFQDEFKDLTYVIVPDTFEKDCPFQIIKCPLKNEAFDLEKLASILYQDYGITSLYVEGGQTVHTSFLKQQLFDRISIYIAPKILGDGLNSIGNLNIFQMQNALNFIEGKWQQIGEDMYFTARRNEVCLQV